MAGEPIKGKNLRITVGGKKVWHATECGLSVTGKTDTVATKDTNGDVVTPSGYSYTLTTSALVALAPAGSTHITADDLMSALLAGDSLAWEFKSTEEGSKIYSGTVFVTQGDINAATEGMANGSFTFTGSGDIAEDVVED